MDGAKLKGPEGGCFCCSVQWSSQWRRGPPGTSHSGEKNLCNKCGVAYYQNQFSWADPIKELMTRRRMLEELKVEEERSALAAVAAALEREDVEHARSGMSDGMCPPQIEVVTERADKQQGIKETYSVDCTAGNSKKAPDHGGASTKQQRSSQPDLDDGKGAGGPEPGALKGVKNAGKSLKAHRMGSKAVARKVIVNSVIEKEKGESKVQSATDLGEEASEAVDGVSGKPQKASANVAEAGEQAALGEGGWEEEDAEQAGSLPGLQEGERCCKSNNRSWRCSRTRHPGSRYCIYHIRDYVDGKLVPRKNPSGFEKLLRTHSTDAEVDAADADGRRKSSRRKGLQQRRATNRASGGRGSEMGQSAESEGSEGDDVDRQGGYSSQFDGDEESSLPPPLLPQQHLPMKKRFAVTPVGRANGEPLQREGFGAFAEGRVVAIGASEKELAEWVLAHNAGEEGGTATREGTAVKSESMSEPGFASTAAASHVPVRVTLGGLPDAFLRAQERGLESADAHLNAGGREPPLPPESSMSPKGESLRRVGMIVQALAGGLDNFGYPEEGAAEAQAVHEQKNNQQAEAEGEAKLAAAGVSPKVEEGEAKGEFKRCIMSGGTGWKCGRPRIEDSKYCQYHFELRRKQRQNSGARAAKGGGKRKPQALKRSPRGGPRASKAAQEAQPRGRKRKLPKVEPVLEDAEEAFPFLSVEFRLQKRTRTKKAVRPHTAVDRLLLAAKVRQEDSLELLSDHQAGRQHLRCLQVDVRDIAEAELSEMDEDEAGAHEALTQMLAASTHHGPSGSDHLKKEDNGPERSTGACAELCKKDSADEAAPTNPPSSAPSSPVAAAAACHALKRLVAAEGAGESDGAEPKRSRSEVHEAQRLAWELRTAEEARARLEAEGAQTAWKLKQEVATRTKLESRLSELAQKQNGEEKPAVTALKEEVAALRHELGKERAVNGPLRKQIQQLKEQLDAQETQYLGHQADLEVLEAKHKDLEAAIAALLLEKHALEDQLFLVMKSHKCLLCHTLTANMAVDPCGCRLCSSCFMLPTKNQTNGSKDRQLCLGALCPACGGAIKGAVKLQRHNRQTGAIGPGSGSSF